MRGLFVLLTGLVVLFCQTESFATPKLGVATDTGIYSYLGGTPPTDKYMKYFASTFESGPVEGFVVGPSGSYLTVFTSYDPTVKDIYLLASTGSDNLPITFGGTNLVSMGTIGQADGYLQKYPYYGIQLSNVLSDWVTVNDTDYFEKTRYLYKRQITYAGDYDQEDYFFASADKDGTSGLQFDAGKKDGFSPKTTSACYGTAKVPEPTTLSLLIPTLLFGVNFIRKNLKKEGR